MVRHPPGTRHAVGIARPIWESGEQVSVENSAGVQIGVAWGLPMKPVGRWTKMFRGSFDPLTVSWSKLMSLVKWISTSGWPPACVLVGITEKLWIENAVAEPAFRATIQQARRATAAPVLRVARMLIVRPRACEPSG